jgi:membrane-associated protease RseP (regulator of RpoE activity)
MEEEKRNTYTVIAIVALVGLVFSCVAGAVAGGLAGYWVGQRQAERVAEQVLEREWGNLPRSGMLPRLWREEPPAPEPLPRIVPPEEMPRTQEGALILEVVPGTPADQAGLMAGDVISAVDRAPIDRDHPLANMIEQYKPGDQITIYFWRANREDSVRIKLGEHPDDPERAYLGVRFQMLTRPEFELPSD